MEVIRFAGLAITPWRNGAGRKADIAGGEGWLVGVAFLDRDAPFSDYAGHDRTITLIDGAGFELDIAGRGVVRVDQPFEPMAFDGGAATACRLLDGPCRVLNAMTERAAYAHRVMIARGPDPTLPAPRAGALSLAVVARGAASIQGGQAVAPMDAIRRDATVTIAGDRDLVCWAVDIVRVAVPGGTGPAE